MGWKAYEVVFRLHSPLHSGWRKVGNLQVTRSYITGRMLWGALTMRLTRNKAGNQPAGDSSMYQKVGKQINEMLAFSYFYPALRENGGYRVCWPWENEGDFRRRFLGSYASTSLSYPQQTAAEGSLHEVEFLSPRTMDDGRQVYLMGYIFKRNGCTLDWRSALKRLQLGGERGYGWGRVEPEEGTPKEVADGRLFNGAVDFDGSGERPYLSIFSGRHLLAHTKADSRLPVEGEIDPLVGREWRSTSPSNRYAGQHVGFTSVCFVPGSKVIQEKKFYIEPLGIWSTTPEAR